MSRSRYIRIIGLNVALASTPFVVFAQPFTVGTFMCGLIEVLNIVIAILMAAAFAVFIWGLAKFVFQADREESWQQARFLMTWGIGALFVMVSIWAILQFLFSQFGFGVQFGNFLLPTGSNPVSPCHAQTP